MASLYEIQTAVHLRTGETAAAHPDWPCQKGCDECCRRLAAVPRVSREEWRRIADALDALPAAVAGPARSRIRESASATRPVVCPLLDAGSGACLIYGARPIACRAYGFYAEREYVLGCGRIHAISREIPDIVWGNHLALEEGLAGLGPAEELFRWIAREDALTSR